MTLRPRYASGPDLLRSLELPCAMSGTDIAHATGSVPPPYAMSGTYIGHMLLSYASAMRCPVLM